MIMMTVMMTMNMVMMSRDSSLSLFFLLPFLMTLASPRRTANTRNDNIDSDNDEDNSNMMIMMMGMVVVMMMKKMSMKTGKVAKQTRRANAQTIHVRHKGQLHSHLPYISYHHEHLSCFMQIYNRKTAQILAFP